MSKIAKERVKKGVRRTALTRKEFLRAAGAGAASTALLGTTGCGLGLGGKEEPKNVILVIIDSLRKDHVGAYGNPWIKTPNLDALAKESLRFTRAYPESMPTICARRTIHTGIRTFPFKDYSPQVQRQAPVRGWLPIPERQTTLAETLREEGYRTFFTSDTYHQFVYNFDRGFEVLREIRGQENDSYRSPSSVSEKEMEKYLQIEPEEIRQYLANTQNRKTEEDWFAPRVFVEASKLLEEASKESQPFFLVADCFDPHEPWDPPEEYVKFYSDGYRGKEPFNPRYGEDDYLTTPQLERMRHLYAGEVTMMDRWLGKFLSRARELGVMEDTLLVLISDHGHLLGEHGYVGKLHYALHPELTDIVLLVRHPEGKSAGKTSDYYASTHDIAPTILGFLGIEPPEYMEGQDLSVLLDGGEPEPRDYMTLGYGEHVWARNEHYAMFCRNYKEEARLYDLRIDPQMKKDVAADDPEMVEKMFEEYVLRDAGGSLLSL
jgi:arylsulfatase A-like enzyme